MRKNSEAFWKFIPLSDMTAEQWESLCDRCGKCCLLKLEDVDTGSISYTNIACKLLDTRACQCTHYNDRHKLVPDCVKITKDNIIGLSWMPKTCAYRLLAEGKDLYPWHPLITGNPNSVHESGLSVRGRCVSESSSGPAAHHILDEEP